MLKSTGEIPTAPQTVALGIPAELLRRRPDVRSAERLAAAQSERIGIAKADYYPSFTLSSLLLVAVDLHEIRTVKKSINKTLAKSQSITGRSGELEFPWEVSYQRYTDLLRTLRVSDRMIAGF